MEEKQIGLFCTWQFDTDEKNIIQGTGERDQWLRGLVALSEALSSVPSTHLRHTEVCSGDVSPGVTEISSAHVHYSVT